MPRPCRNVRLQIYTQRAGSGCLILNVSVWLGSSSPQLLTWSNGGAGADVLVEGDGGSLAPLQGDIGGLVAGLHDVPPGGELVVQGEITWARGLQGHLSLHTHLKTAQE